MQQLQRQVEDGQKEIIEKEQMQQDLQQEKDKQVQEKAALIQKFNEVTISELTIHTCTELDE